MTRLSASFTIAATVTSRSSSFRTSIRLQLACLFGRYQDALALSEKGEAVVRSAAGFTQVADHYLYRGLAAAVALTGAMLTPRRHRKTLRHCLARVHLFAVNSPHNFRPHEALLEAEARTRGRPLHRGLEALQPRDRAGGGGRLQRISSGSPMSALPSSASPTSSAGWQAGISPARERPMIGGAPRPRSLGSIASTQTSFRRPLSRPLRRPQTRSRRANTAIHSSRHPGESFDIAAALHASRIIASGENTEGVLTHLMQVIRVQAGAESAHLLVLEGGKLRLEASATVDSGGVMLFPSSSDDGGQGSFSPAIVNHVLHTGHDLMLVDAGADARFAQCSYVANRRPKSVLCSAIRHQGEVLGVIYLEHTQIAGAFDGQKLEWLRLLATEVGLTVWSARLSRYRDYVHKFAPAAVAKEIDANPASPNLEAKDSDVTILFGDLAGYTRMAEQMERRQLDELMNRILSRFVDEIHRYEGTLLEIRGDEIFVLFADEDHSRHVSKAASAALALSRAATSLKEELSGAHPPIILNMGINSGVASVGLKAVEASSGARWRYGASGTVVNIAARVRELARDGSILISADSAARMPNEFVLEDMGEHSLKNVKDRVRVYRLIGERGSRHAVQLH